MAIVAQPFRIAPSLLEYLPALRCKLNGIGNAFQPLYLFAAIGGAALAAALSGVLAWRTEIGDPLGGMPYAHSFIGGFLIIFGSRLNDGCTSGAGISGFTQGAVNGVIGTASMFAFGIAFAFILKASGGYPDFVFEPNPAD